MRRIGARSPGRGNIRRQVRSEDPGFGRRAPRLDIEKKIDGGECCSSNHGGAQSQNNHCPFLLTSLSVHGPTLRARACLWLACRRAGLIRAKP